MSHAQKVEHVDHKVESLAIKLDADHQVQISSHVELDEAAISRLNPAQKAQYDAKHYGRKVVKILESDYKQARRTIPEWVHFTPHMIAEQGKNLALVCKLTATELT